MDQNTRSRRRILGNRRQAGFVLPLLSLGVLGITSSASALVTEPDGRLVPQPLTEDVTAGVVSCCGVLADGSNMSLQALFASRGEAIDWQADAATEPQYFSPLCDFQGSLILRGGGCKIDFGWYNVDLNNPLPPSDVEIFPLVSRAQIEAAMLSGVYGAPNNDMAFAPKVGEPPIEGALIGNIRTDPNYRGGLIGLATRAGTATCTQTHYSEARLNIQSIYGSPWIMALVWRSTTTPNAFYIGFEDLPVSPDRFDLPTTPDGYLNDGDFNDFVYFVQGITCEGGGQPCLGTSEGVCGYGLTECLPDGTLVCVPQLQPGPEVCDNLDNDCDGLVDNGDLCPVGEICDKGVCKPSCSGGEFPCSSDLICDDSTGLCVDPLCLNVVCETGQVCIAGTCLGGCDGAVCPVGQICQLGRCVDPCLNRAPGGPNPCPEGTVCEGGACLETCHCRACAPGLECDLVSGKCMSPGCASIPCGAGTVCQMGACVDACQGVVCPGGALCAAGICGDPIPGQPVQNTGGTGGIVTTGGTGGLVIGTGATGGGSSTPPPGFSDLCTNTCATASNGVCEDGGPRATGISTCAYGTDCVDCQAANTVDALCSDTCATAGNGICEDSGGTPLCEAGTDCTDCGFRWDGSESVPPAASGGGLGASDPGCGCRAAGNDAQRAGLVALLLAALGLGGLRRRSRR